MDLSLIGRQLRREIEQGEEARRRLESQTRTAHERAYGSSTVYGQKLLKTKLGLVAEHLTKRLKSLGRGKGAVDGASVYRHLKAADPEILAVLTMKVALDVLGQEKAPSVTQLTTAIGAAVECELRLSWYKDQDPDLYRQVTNRFHSSTGTRRSNGLSASASTKLVSSGDIGRGTKHKIGAWCLDGLISATGWIEKTWFRPLATDQDRDALQPGVPRLTRRDHGAIAPPGLLHVADALST